MKIGILFSIKTKVLTVSSKRILYLIGFHLEVAEIVVAAVEERPQLFGHVA